MAEGEIVEGSVWVFGYGSLIWDTGTVQPVEVRDGFLDGWHREWTWISSRRYGAPTCSLAAGGRVRGVFLRLAPDTALQDLEAFRRRERRQTENTVVDVPHAGGRTHFWTMGTNLDGFTELRDLVGDELYRALARRARQIDLAGPDGVRPSDYIHRVCEFDPEDELTARFAAFLNA